MIKEEDFPRSDLKDGVQTLDKRKNHTLGKSDKIKRFHSDDKHLESSDTSDVLKFPSLESISPGSLVLGSVSMLTNSGLRIHIPNNIVGFAKLSELYDLCESEDLFEESIVTSPFRPGSNVVCYVLEVHQSFVSLSLKPSLINKNLRMDSLFPGLLLPSTVLSQEDHGLIVSFNCTLKNSTKGFVIYDEESRENVKNDFIKRYPVSSTCYVVVVSVNLDRGLIKCQWPWFSKTPLKVTSNPVFDSLKPGLFLKAEVSRVHRLNFKHSTRNSFGGYTVKCLGSLNAFITPLHSIESYKSSRDEEFGDYLEDYRQPEDTVECRLIFVDFEARKLYLSIQSHILRWKGPLGQDHKKLKHSVYFLRITRSISSGFILESTQDPKENYYNSFFCEIDNVLDEKKVFPETILGSSNYSIGTEHKCRVLEFDYFTRLIRVSMKKSVISEKYVSPFELSPSDVVKGKIVNLVNSGAIVEISSMVHGKVPLGHLTDVPPSKLPDNYQIGRKLTLRVLKFDHHRNRLILTAKNLLVNDPNPLYKFEQLYVGKQLLGYIINKKEKEYGDETQNDKVVVKFYDDMQTLLDKEEVESAKEYELQLETDFVVKCAVTKVFNKRRLFFVTVDTLKMEKLESIAKFRKESRREKRRLECKKVFTNYKSKKKDKIKED